MSDKPIDLDRRRDVLKRMTALEREVKELRKQLVGPEQLAQLAYAEMKDLERGFKPLSESFKRSQEWLLDMLLLQGVALKLAGHDADPADCLAVFTRSSDFAKDSFKTAVLARIATLEDGLVK